MTALPRAALYGGLVAVLAACFLASLAFGPAGLGGARALGALFGADDAAARLIVHEVRVPRALLAVAVGGSLGLAGAALQGFLRNPLAENLYRRMHTYLRLVRLDRRMTVPLAQRSMREHLEIIAAVVAHFTTALQRHLGMFI